MFVVRKMKMLPLTHPKFLRIL